VECGVPPARLNGLAVLGRLREALVAANQALNLTRITSEADYWWLHVADSLSVGRAWPAILTEPLAVADVGCGAGFPLLPLAWANPALRGTGIESRRKKAAFVAEQIRALGLEGAGVVAGRAREAARRPEHAGRYDAVVLRAAGAAGKLVRECRGLLRPAEGSRMVFYKTPPAVAAERAEIEREAGKFALAVEVSPAFTLPGNRGERQFVTLLLGK